MASQAAEIVTSVLPRISGSLSIIGSSAIMFSMIMDGRKKLGSSFNRLLFMMCCLDLFASFAHVWSSSALPKGDMHFSYGAVGNWTTCRVQGFMFQLGMAVPIYFYFLTIHYLLVIKYGMKEERISRKIEPLMHAFALTFAIGTAVTGYILKLFNPFGNVCFISEYPKYCFKEDSDVDCIYGQNLSIFRWIFAGIPWILPLFLVPSTMGLIFWTVRKQTLKMNRYSQNSIVGASDSSTRQSFTMRRSFTMRQSFTNGQSTSEDNFPSDFSTLRRKLKCKTTERLKAVAHQCLAYTLCYLSVFSWPIIMALIIMYSKDNRPPLPIICVCDIFYPLQGFLNYIVYIRPFVVQMRKAHPERSILQAMCLVTFPKRPCGRTNEMSICHQLNCCSRKLDVNKCIESVMIEFQSKNGATNSKDEGASIKGLEEEKEEIDELPTTQRCAEDDEKALFEALARASLSRDETEEGLSTEQEIEQEREYLQAITELSKITGNYSY